MPPALARVSAAALFAFALLRARQGWRVLRYQRHLRRLPDYRIAAARIPVSHSKLFLGLGFRWTQRHTQRLRDTLRPENARYVGPGLTYRWARQAEIALESHPRLRPLVTVLRSGSRWNPWRPLPAVGGLPALHGVEPDEQAVWMNLSERVGHTLVLGTTREIGRAHV